MVDKFLQLLESSLCKLLIRFLNKRAEVECKVRRSPRHLWELLGVGTINRNKKSVNVSSNLVQSDFIFGAVFVNEKACSKDDGFRPKEQDVSELLVRK